MYLTSQRTGVRLRIPLLPDRLNVKTGASVVSFSVIKTGEVKIPRGSTLTGYSWTSVFPGEAMSGASFVFDWQKPANIISMLEDWQANGDTVTLLVTELSINVDTFIESFVYEYYGTGNASYTINLTKRLQLSVTTSPAPIVPPAEETETTDSIEQEKKYGVVTGGRVNYRKGPGTKYKSYGIKTKGTKVEILGKSGNWYKIAYAKGEGGVAWMSATYIKLTSGSSSSSSGSSSSSSSGKKNPNKGSSSSNQSTAKKDTVYKAPSSSLVNAVSSAVKAASVVSKVVKATSSAIKAITGLFKKK